MDSSPLVLARDHAQAAAVATRRASDTTVAISEHTQAAGEFANAARNTSSVEALRTLKLLEEHHRKLAEILKLPNDHATSIAEADVVAEKSQTGKEYAVASDATLDKDAAQDQHAASKAARVPGVAQQRRYAAREMSSSIASNLATARGIRSKYRGQSLSPSVSNDQAPGNVDPHPRRDGSKTKMQHIIDRQSGKPAWVPPPVSQPTISESLAKIAASPKKGVAPTAEDHAYARFYNTFGSLINKISAPLAFAGLPLAQDEPSMSVHRESPTIGIPSAKQKHPRAPSTVSLEPDLSKIYSKATMRALAREGHSTSDSFYVVPTSGHTMSYANILTYAEKEKRRLEASDHGEPLGGPDDEDDEFLEARETAASLSAGAKRRIGRARTEKELQNTIEELYVENKSLKDMLDKLSKRLHAFEASAQMPAMALTESYRLMRPGSPVAAGNGKLPDDVSRRTTQETEEQLHATMKQMERLEKDNRKMQKTLANYREKWDGLKAGAKARREAQMTPEAAEAADPS